MSFEYWFMLPISVMVATTAMATGVEGATFFAPIFLILLGLPPEVAIGTGLLTEVFGFASGLYAYGRKRIIDYRLGLSLLLVTIPVALLGTIISGEVSPDFLRILLGLGLLLIGGHFLLSDKHASHPTPETVLVQDGERRCIHTSAGEVICYAQPIRWEGRLWSGIGALFMGMVSTGLGEMNGFFFLKRSKIPVRVATATSVFVVAITAIAASGGHIIRVAQSSSEALMTMLSLIIFTIPGVIIGGQIGPRLASRVSQQVMENGLGILFILIGLVLLGQSLIGA